MLKFKCLCKRDPEIHTQLGKVMMKKDHNGVEYLGLGVDIHDHDYMWVLCRANLIGFLKHVHAYRKYSTIELGW